MWLDKPTRAGNQKDKAQNAAHANVNSESRTEELIDTRTYRVLVARKRIQQTQELRIGRLRFDSQHT